MTGNEGGEVLGRIRIGPIEVTSQDNQIWEDVITHSVDEESIRAWREAGRLGEFVGFNSISEGILKHTTALQFHNSEVPNDSRLRLIIESPEDQTPEEARNEVTSRVNLTIEPDTPEMSLGQLRRLKSKVQEMVGGMKIVSKTTGDEVLDQIKLVE